MGDENGKKANGCRFGCLTMALIAGGVVVLDPSDRTADRTKRND